MDKKYFQQIFEQIKKKYNIVGADADAIDAACFELLNCSLLFNKPIHMAQQENWICFAKNKNKEKNYSCSGEDGKIDGFNIIVTEDKVIIEGAQMKFSNKAKTSDIGPFFESFYRYIISLNDVNDSNGYTEVKKLQEKVRHKITKEENKRISYKLYVSFIGSKKDKEKPIQDEFNRVFKDCNAKVCLEVVDGDDIVGRLEKVKKKIREDDFSDVSVRIDSCDGDFSLQKVNHKCNGNCVESKVLIGVTSGKSIIDMIETEFKVNLEVKRLFNNNVRGFLSNTTVNDEIVKTINELPEFMILRNNGALIVCDELYSTTKDNIHFSNPVIINGQQTFCSIYNNRDKDFDQLKVPIKIVELPIALGGTERLNLMNEIAKASNQANIINNLDLISNTTFVNGLKKVFADQDIYLKIKDGEVLNEVFIESNSTLDFEDMLKMWSACALKRLDFSKSKKKAIELLFKGTFVSENKFFVFFNDKSNVEKIYQSFLDVYVLFQYKDDIHAYFNKMPYYEHGEYMIYYLLYHKYQCTRDKYSNVKEKLSEIFIEIESIVSSCINKEKERKISEVKEYTHNNYFKCTRPISDYDDSICLETFEILNEIVS